MLETESHIPVRPQKRTIASRAALVEKKIESWFSFLMSGFEKKFMPSPKPQLSARLANSSRRDLG